MSPDFQPHSRVTRTRREFVRDACCGFGGLALASLLHDEQLRAAPASPLLAKQAHHAAKAKSVIFLFMAGGPSHLETFDPKPLLNKLNGQVRPAEFGEAKYQFIQRDARLLGTQRTFKKYGESGIEVSDLFPKVATCIDDIAVLRSCHGDMVVHSAAQYELFSGRTVPGFPSMGSWTLYGLGAETQSLPAYVVMPDPKGALEAGQPMYMHGFLPAIYQPTMFRPGEKPVLNLDLPAHVKPSQRRRTLQFIRELNETTLDPADEPAPQSTGHSGHEHDLAHDQRLPSAGADDADGADSADGADAAALMLPTLVPCRVPPPQANLAGRCCAVMTPGRTT